MSRRKRTPKPHSGGIPRGSRSDAAYETLLGEIQSGRYRSGDFLPTMRELAAQLGGSITPVVHALKQLAAEGLVERIHGSGVRLTKTPGDRRFDHDPVIAIPATRPLQDYRRAKERLHRHANYASQEWLIHQLLQQDDIRIQLSPLNPQENDAGLVRVLEKLLMAPPAGFCLVEPERISDDAVALMRKLQTRRTHVALLVAFRDAPDFDRVTLDFASGQYQLTRHVLSLGHKSVLRLCSSMGYDWEQRKQQGYAQALVEGGFPPAHAKNSCLEIGEPQGSGPEVVGSAIRLIGETLDRHKPTAIFAVNDSHAALVRVALRFLGRSDILITGYDNSWDELVEEVDPLWLGRVAKAFPEDLPKKNPPITIDCHREKAGSALAQLVLDRLRGRLPEEKQVVLIKQSLVVPESTTPTELT